MKDVKFIALDLETTGKYPFGSEICEIAMIKFDSDGIHDSFESLICPKGSMTVESEGVHGLSLASLSGEPRLEEVLPKVLDFIGDSSLLGHNLPFDLGFLACDFDRYFASNWWEKNLLSPNFCTSLISLQTHPKLKTHRLKYLCEYFDVQTSPNHRAMQDAQSCMEVFLKLTETVANIEDLIEIQKDRLLFKDYSAKFLSAEVPSLLGMVEACKSNSEFELMYSKGSRKNKWRKLQSKGLVMKTQNDSFVVGVDEGEIQTKRFMLSKVLDTRS